MAYVLKQQYLYPFGPSRTNDFKPLHCASWCRSERNRCKTNCILCGLFVCLFVCGISLKSGQLIMSSFQTATRSCFSQVFFYGTRCPLYSATSLGYHVIGPHAYPPNHIILTPGQRVMCYGTYFIMSTMQEGTSPIFKVFGMTGPSTNRKSNPQNLLASAESPLSSPFTISRGYCRPSRHEGAPSGALTLDPHVLSYGTNPI